VPASAFHFGRQHHGQKTLPGFGRLLNRWRGIIILRGFLGADGSAAARALKTLSDLIYGELDFSTAAETIRGPHVGDLSGVMDRYCLPEWGAT
jgi:hypothetical protein